MQARKILIVDDDHEMLKALTLRLKSNGYATVTAIDGKSAITAASERPDLILLDLGLEDDNGFMVMGKLKHDESLNSIPVIVVTGRSSKVYKDAAMLSGARAFFEKPATNEELLASIRTILSE